MTGNFERFTTMFLVMTRHWNEVATQELKKYGIKGAHGVYLMILNESDGITSGKLAKIAKRDKADVSRAVDAFLENGLIKLKGETNYRAEIVLTAKGKKLLVRISDKIREFISDISGDMTEEREYMLRALEVMELNLKNKYMK